MRDTEIFGSLLGLTSDWVVSSVDLVSESSSVRITVEHVGESVCPECGVSCPVHDHSEERLWRHLDTMQFMTFVACRVPRVSCLEHGVRQLTVPWSGPKSRFTSMFEALGVKLLLLTRCQVRAARILRLSAGQVHRIMHRAVGRGLSLRHLGRIEHLSVDEKSFQRGHVYGTVLVDVFGRRVLDVALGRDERAARSLFEGLPKQDEVKTVTMDMHPAYKSAALCLPFAEVIHDRFHVAKNLAEAVDRVRRSETKTVPALKGSRYLWLKNAENRTQAQNLDFQHLMQLELKTSRAYAFKQVFRGFFEQESIGDAQRFFDEWNQEVESSDLEPMKKVAKMLRRNKQGLIAYVKHKLTNGYAECVNALIQEIKTIARGFRRFENFKVAILFFLGKLNLNPRNVS
jgi:transposase